MFRIGKFIKTEGRSDEWLLTAGVGDGEGLLMGTGFLLERTEMV